MMLRRRLLLILSSLVLLLVGVAIVAVFLLQGLLADLRHIRNEASMSVDQVSRLSGHVAQIQIELYRLQLKDQRHLDALLDSAESIQKILEQLDTRYVMHLPDVEAAYRELVSLLPVFFKDVGSLATSQDADLARRHNDAALNTAIAMDRDILRMLHGVRSHADAEQTSLIERFRWLVLGLAVAFLLLINSSILILLHAAEMVLQPIDRLVAASRALGEERFEHRVELVRKDEFGELAAAYNHLAERLQANEQHRLEMLGQVAVTMNHELNNAMAIIELQLELLKRSAREETGQDKYLRQIRQSLERIQGTVDSLKRVRRIVLKDYVQGTKMLDLQRSTQDEPSAGPAGEEEASR